jgi:hypothetical protein
MRMDDVKEEAWSVCPDQIPTKVVPDYDALFPVLDARGWLVLELPPEDHRVSTSGALESKTVKDFKNWVLNNKHLMLSIKRLGQYRWYLTIGAPYKRNPRKGESK